MNTRIYLVTDVADSSPVLVKASSPAQALRHVTEGMFTVKVPTQDELVAAIEGGAVVEVAKLLDGAK